MKVFLKNFIIFSVGFTIYQIIEGLFKNFMIIISNGSYLRSESFLMGLIGGGALLLIGLINKKFAWNIPIWIQSLVGGIGILLFEFAVGLFMNKFFCPHYGITLIWDYSSVPGNILGQICPQYFIIWVLLAALCILIDDYLRYKIYNEEKPHYYWWFH